jgi:UDP-N-acetylmuramoyl-tripeptide--D-alanyl-D-alanine ligase
VKLTVGRIAELCGGELLYGDAQARVTSAAIDSRKLAPGGMFIALRGEHDDGHNYVNRAIKEGAALIMVSKPEAAEHVVGLAARKGCAAILVEDTKAALHELAHEWVAIIDPIVIGITGSTGKTSTKEMMACVLGQRFKVAYTDGNQNNEIGVPLTVLGAEEGDEVLIVEMGMRGSGQIAELCDIVSPSIGVVTSIGPSHIELLGSMDAIIEAKAELLRALPAEGLGVFEADKPYSGKFADATVARTMTVGVDSDDAKIMATKVKLDASGCPSAHVMSLKDEFDIALNVAGLHQLTNALAVVAVAQELGLPSVMIERGLSAARLTGMRFKIDINHNTEVIVINDAYNANPNSMEQAIWTLAAMEVFGRRVCVLGDMLELGEISADEHYKIGAICAKAGIDALYAYGDYAASLVKGAQDAGLADAWAYDWIELDILIEQAKEYLSAGDCVLVKASRGIELERVAYALLDLEVPATATTDENRSSSDATGDQATEPLQTVDPDQTPVTGEGRRDAR